MNKLKYCFASLLFLFAAIVSAQEEVKAEREQGHTAQSKFRQMYQEFATPNTYRSASGAPGPDYYQQQANYKMDILLDDKNTKIYGTETITYINNSPDDLEYLWLQLDQNVRTKDSKSLLKDGDGVPLAEPTSGFVQIKIREWVSDYQYEIYNVLGQTLKFNELQNNEILDLSDLPSDIYFMKITEIETNKILIKKIVLNK